MRTWLQREPDMTDTPLRLYGYFRSSAAFRTRIALNLKGLAYETAPVDLLGGEQRAESFAALNPQKLVPLLEVDGRLVNQSLAIIEYLDEVHPEPPLLPGDALERAQIRAFALAIACDIHPLNNLRVLQHLTGPMGRSEAEKDAWYRHWIAEGLEPLEQMMATRPAPSPFCFGDRPTLADICLVPQLANARRTRCDLTPYPNLLKIEANCLALDAFHRATPELQPR